MSILFVHLKYFLKIIIKFVYIQLIIVWRIILKLNFMCMFCPNIFFLSLILFGLRLKIK